MTNHGGVIRRNPPKPSQDPVALIRWAGYEDRRLGKPYNKAYEKMKDYLQRNYERGRLQASTIFGSWGMIPPWNPNEHFESILRNVDPDVADDLYEEEKYLNQGLRVVKK